MSGRVGWFADVDRESINAGWQPCLETGTGHIPSFEMWFDTKEECERWIREDLLPIAGLVLDD